MVTLATVGELGRGTRHASERIGPPRLLSVRIGKSESERDSSAGVSTTIGDVYNRLVGAETGHIAHFVETVSSDSTQGQLWFIGRGADGDVRNTPIAPKAQFHIATQQRNKSLAPHIHEITRSSNHITAQSTDTVGKNHVSTQRNPRPTTDKCEEPRRGAKCRTLALQRRNPCARKIEASFGRWRIVCPKFSSELDCDAEIMRMSLQGPDWALEVTETVNKKSKALYAL